MVGEFAGTPCTCATPRISVPNVTTDSGPLPAEQLSDVRKPSMTQNIDAMNGVWVTPWEFFNPYKAEFDLQLDVAASASNTKCARFFDEDTNGLAQSWEGERVWCNPPYGRTIGEWIKKAATSKAAVCVCLLPARTDTRWFHDWVLPFASEIRWIKGRIKFSGMDQAGKFPSMVVIYRGGGN